MVALFPVGGGSSATFVHACVLHNLLLSISLYLDETLGDHSFRIKALVQISSVLMLSRGLICDKLQPSQVHCYVATTFIYHPPNQSSLSSPSSRNHFLPVNILFSHLRRYRDLKLFVLFSDRQDGVGNRTPSPAFLRSVDPGS